MCSGGPTTAHGLSGLLDLTRSCASGLRFVTAKRPRRSSKGWAGTGSPGPPAEAVPGVRFPCRPGAREPTTRYHPRHEPSESWDPEFLSEAGPAPGPATVWMSAFTLGRADSRVPAARPRACRTVSSPSDPGDSRGRAQGPVPSRRVLREEQEPSHRVSCFKCFSPRGTEHSA